MPYQPLSLHPHRTRIERGKTMRVPPQKRVPKAG